jgi:hypothetical protein
MIFTPTLSADAALSKAPDYAAWVKAAREHDARSGMQSWRDADESDHYDYKAIRARLEKLRGLSAAGDVKGLLFVLNEGIHGNIDGMGHERLYQKARFGTKKLIEDYIAEIGSAASPPRARSRWRRNATSSAARSIAMGARPCCCPAPAAFFSSTSAWSRRCGPKGCCRASSRGPAADRSSPR